MRRYLVSGIGRSGTTLIYQQLAKLIRLENLKTNFRYEPYLWNICSHTAKGNSFGMDQLSHFGLHTHTTAPLFLAGTDPLHDTFLDGLFDAPWDGDLAVTPDACLTKVIRGSGRLRSYLARFPDLKIIACLRNPFDTINSSLGMFSFFGEEFHASDRERFKADMIARGMPADSLPDGGNSVEWYAEWWKVFTDETLAVAAEFPDNVFLFCYEEFQQDSDKMLEALQDFVGIHNEGIYLGLSKPAGPTIKSTSLTAHDIALIQESFDTYAERVLIPRLGEVETRAMEGSLVKKYVEGNFSLPIAGTDLGRKSPIQLRGMMLSGAKSPFQELTAGKRSPVNLSGLIQKHASERGAALEQTPYAHYRKLKKGKTFGVVITCHNNSGTIISTVLSVLNQTLPYDEVVVVDDKSSDGSQALLKTLAEQYSSVRIVALESCLGPSAARHIGISRLSTDFCTQLDGDDMFWPTKNEGEVRAIDGDENAIAFSDIMLVLPDTSGVQSTSAYSCETSEEVFDQLLARTRQIPRDMTLPRARYFEVGGYDLLADLYEDWDFKLRLAAHPDLSWRRSQSLAGTVYNRLTPGLSGKDPGLHARFLILIFLKALRHRAISPQHALLAFDKALGPFRDRAITTGARGWLERLVQTGRFDAARLGAFAASREVHALSQADFRELMQLLASRGGPDFVDLGRPADEPTVWKPENGLEKWDPADKDDWFFALRSRIRDLFTLPRMEAFIEIDLPDAADGLVLDAYFEPKPFEITLDVLGVSHKESVITSSAKALQSVPLPLRLPKGKSLARIHIRPLGKGADIPDRLILVENIRPLNRAEAKA